MFAFAVVFAFDSNAVVKLDTIGVESDDVFVVVVVDDDDDNGDDDDDNDDSVVDFNSFLGGEILSSPPFGL